MVYQPYRAAPCPRLNPVYSRRGLATETTRPPSRPARFLLHNMSAHHHHYTDYSPPLACFGPDHPNQTRPCSHNGSMN